MVVIALVFGSVVGLALGFLGWGLFGLNPMRAVALYFAVSLAVTVLAAGLKARRRF